MGRLIDADELTKVMTEDWFLDILLTQTEKSDLKKRLVDMVDSVPLAYDIEKVVAELKGKKDEAGIIASLRATRVGEDEYEEEPYHEGKKHAYGHAIELLRKGGAE